MSSSAVIAIPYALVAVALVRPLAGHFAYRFVRMDRGYGAKNEPSGEFWFGATCLALGAALVWPLLAAMLVLGRWRVGEERQALAKQQHDKVVEGKARPGLGRGFE